MIIAAVASILQLFPTGDQHGTLVTKYQPIALAALEGLFQIESGVSIVLIGQPDTDNQKFDNPIYVPKARSFLTHRHWKA